MTEITRSDVESWVQRYVRAWNSNEPDDIAVLFTDDAIYLTSPFDAPWKGREEIVAGWLQIKDEPGDTTFAFEVIAIDRDLAVVEGRTTYKEPATRYGNVWLIRLAHHGRCASFTEYWMEGSSKADH